MANKYFTTSVNGVDADDTGNVDATPPAQNGVNINAGNVELGGPLINADTSITIPAGSGNTLYIGDGATTYDSTIEIGEGYEIHEYQSGNKITGLTLFGTDCEFYFNDGTATPNRAGIQCQRIGSESVMNLNGIISIVTSLQNYANNAAAITGGLAVGTLYRNGDIVQIVH